MLTKTIDVKKRLPDLKGLLSLVADGTEVVLTKDNTPIARLVPISKRIAGLHSGAIWMSEDFDEPLPDEFWTGNARSCSWILTLSFGGIANLKGFEKAQEEIRILEERLERLQKTHPIGSKGSTKAGIRKMIRRLHEELAVYEGSEEARQPVSS